jgi:hypothetical protein
LFSTPLSTGSGSTGGGIGLVRVLVCSGVVMSLHPVVVSLPTPDSTVFVPTPNCETKAHWAQKVTLELGFLYILGTRRKDQAILEPSLNGNLLADEQEIVKIAEASKPVNVWKAFFRTQSDHKDFTTSSEAASDASWEDLKSPSLDKLSSMTSSYVTPKKLKVWFLLEAFADSIPIGMSKAQTLSELPDFSAMNQSEQDKAGVGALKMVMTEWNVLRSNFELVNDEFENLGNGKKRYRDAISETVLNIHDVIRDTDVRTRLLSAQIGSANTEASGHGTNSIRHSIQRIYETSTLGIQNELEKAILQSTDVETVKAQVLSKMETLDTNFHGLHKYTQENLAKIAQNLRNIEAKRPTSGSVSGSLEYQRLLARFGITDDIIEQHTKDIGKSNRAVAKLDSEVSSLKRKFASIEGNYGTDPDLVSTC